jgi:hypothetical protein
MVKAPAKKNHDEISHETAVEDHAPELHLEAVLEDGAEPTAEEANMVATVATVGVVGIGVALVEAALLPGLILGVAAMAVPKFAPKLGAAIAPMFKHTVRGVYRASQKAREFVAETQEHVQDIVAEVDAESGAASVKHSGAPLQ